MKSIKKHIEIKPPTPDKDPNQETLVAILPSDILLEVFGQLSGTIVVYAMYKIIETTF
jgi:hypothetical protein